MLPVGPETARAPGHQIRGHCRDSGALIARPPSTGSLSRGYSAASAGAAGRVDGAGSRFRLSTGSMWTMPCWFTTTRHR